MNEEEQVDSAYDQMEEAFSCIDQLNKQIADMQPIVDAAIAMESHLSLEGTPKDRTVIIQQKLILALIDEVLKYKEKQCEPS